jgi:glycine dehydrogenase subunit 2
VLSSPQRSTVHQLDQAPHDDPARWALTWRAYQRKRGAGAAAEEPALEPESTMP